MFPPPYGWSGCGPWPIRSDWMDRAVKLPSALREPMTITCSPVARPFTPTDVSFSISVVSVVLTRTCHPAW